ncbi:MAG: NAD(P)-dependent oxidoreductase, partial [Nocardioidaceae bacterium]
LRVWNRTRERAEPLAGAGAQVAGSAADAVRGADVVLTMLYDTASVEAALTEARGGLASGTVLLQQSTVGVDGADRLAEVAAEANLVYVDAPVLGTRKPAEDGALVVLASGPDDVRDLVTPVLDAVGSRTMWLGAAGAGSRLKMVANAWVLAVLEGIAQSLRLADALGLDPHLFLEAVSGGAMDAPYVQLKGASMLESRFEPAFTLDGAIKDADLILEAATGAGTRAELVEVARDYLVRASRAGHGAADMAATHLGHQETPATPR